MAAPSGELATRVVVGAALIVVAVAAVWAGGVAFTALVAAACLLMSAEWSVMHGVARGFRLASLMVLAFVAGVTVYVSAADAVIVLSACAGLLGLFMQGFDRQRAFWVAAGLLYCGLPMLALLWLRAVPTVGLQLTACLFVIVWAVDITAFFTGRTVGGPKFAPHISPNKTWAGVAGGLVAAVMSGALGWFIAAALSTPFLFAFGRGDLTSILLKMGAVGGLLGGVAIAGDLFESWLKRRAGVKDSGSLLPGHGGVMDRIDGLVPVAVVAAVAAYAAGWGR